jgi:hypothetical protein
MPIAFPPIRPTEFRYVSGLFPAHRNAWLEILTRKQLQGSVAVGAQIEATFANRSDDEAALLILRIYEQARKDYDSLTLPIELVAGVRNQSLRARIRTPLGCSWFFAEEPTQSSVKAGLSTITIKLEARL